jgi:hypothetical protein
MARGEAKPRRVSKVHRNCWFTVLYTLQQDENCMGATGITPTSKFWALSSLSVKLWHTQKCQELWHLIPYTCEWGVSMLHLKMWIPYTCGWSVSVLHFKM